MSKYFIVSWPESTRLIEQSWYYECIPYGAHDTEDSFLVPEKRVISIFGKHHTQVLHSDMDERIHEEYGYDPKQFELDFRKI